MFSCRIDYYLFARRNAGFQNDARRKEREMKRNRRMTKTLASISVTFAISWLPYHTFFILTDTFSLWQGYVRYVYIKYILLSPYVTCLFLKDQLKKHHMILGACHCIAMTSIFTNPLMYGWFNTSLRSELETLFPKCCRAWLNRR